MIPVPDPLKVNSPVELKGAEIVKSPLPLWVIVLDAPPKFSELLPAAAIVSLTVAELLRVRTFRVSGPEISSVAV